MTTTTLYWHQLCGACHKLEEHEPKDKEAYSHPWDPMFSAHTRWRCSACERTNRALRKFDAPEKLHEECQALWGKMQAKHDNDPIKIWAAFPGRDTSTMVDVVKGGYQIMHVNLSENSSKTVMAMSTKGHLVDGLLEGSNPCFRVLREPFAVRTTPAAAGIRKLLVSDYDGSARGYVKATARYCEENPDDLIVLNYKRLVLPRTQGGHLFVGSVVLIDILPALDQSSRLEAQQIGFMRGLVDYALEVHSTPQGEDQLCMLLYSAFKHHQDSYLGCPQCFPTKKSRRDAKQKMFDPSTATILVDSPCPHFNLSNTYLKPYQKVVTLHLIWPDCLPKHRQDQFEWLENKVERSKAIKEIVGEPDSRKLLKCHSDAISSTFQGMDESNPLYQAMKSEFDTLPRHAFFFAVGNGLRSRATADGKVCLTLRIEKKTFRQPAVNCESSNDGSWLQKRFGIEYKRCALCNKEELVSRSFKQCPCKEAFYCCKEHQVDHWPTHKLCCNLKK